LPEIYKIDSSTLECYNSEVDDDLYYYDFDEKPQVCMTHRKFVPCRKNDGCVISADPYNVNLVRDYQNGDWY